jgi:hypothetical protein
MLKSPVLAQQMDNDGFDPNDKLSYHNIGAGIKPVISSDDQVSTEMPDRVV